MVITILGTLVAIAIPVYQAQILASKEAVLEHNLAILRERIDQYKADRDAYPPSLAALVEARYLREVPVDPMTERAEWEEGFCRIRSGKTGTRARCLRRAQLFGQCELEWKLI